MKVELRPPFFFGALAWVYLLGDRYSAIYAVHIACPPSGTCPVLGDWACALFFETKPRIDLR
jgi:hypothetical protein